MGVNASRVKFLMDAAAAVTLRDITDGAEAPSGSTVWEPAVSLNELRTAYWHNYEIPHGVFVVVAHVTALNLSTNDYTLKLRVDDVAAQNNNPVEIAAYPITAAGVYNFYVDSKTAAKLDPDVDGTGKFLAIGVQESGTPDSPSITYGAWIAKNVSP